MKRKEIIHLFKILKRIAKLILCKLVELSLLGVMGKNEGKKLLIVRIDAIGDFIIFSPMLKYYRMLYSDYHITLLVNKLAVELVERFNEIDELISFDRKRFNRDIIYRRILLKKIKGGAFNVSIYPTYSREPDGDYIVRFSEATHKIGFDGDMCNITEKQKIKNKKYYTKLIPARSGIIVETERNKEFVEVLGIKVNNAIPSFTPSRKDEIEARRLLSDNGLKDGKLSIVICPGAGSEKKMWPLENYAKLVTWLKEEKDVEVIISGSTNEGHLAKNIESIAKFPVIDITAKTTLPVLAAILKKSLLYVGSDSGILHLAAAVRTPTICIMGGGHLGRFFPYGDLNKNRVVYKKMDCFGCNWRCIYPNKIGAPAPCISNIHVNDVLREIEMVLNEIKEIRK